MMFSAKEFKKDRTNCKGPQAALLLPVKTKEMARAALRITSFPRFGRTLLGNFTNWFPDVQEICKQMLKNLVRAA